MTTRASSGETMQAKNEFIHFEDRASDHPFVEKVWRCRSDRADTFLSIAANNFEMALTRLGGISGNAGPVADLILQDVKNSQEKIMVGPCGLEPQTSSVSTYHRQER